MQSYFIELQLPFLFSIFLWDICEVFLHKIRLEPRLINSPPPQTSPQELFYTHHPQLINRCFPNFPEKVPKDTGLFEESSINTQSISFQQKNNFKLNLYVFSRKISNGITFKDRLKLQSPIQNTIKLFVYFGQLKIHINIRFFRARATKYF